MLPFYHYNLLTQFSGICAISPHVIAKSSKILFTGSAAF